MFNRAATPYPHQTIAGALLASRPVWAQAVAVLVGTAVLAALAQVRVEIPPSPVPITGQTLGVLLIGAAFGSRLGAATVIAYLVEGASGLPVFTRGGSGMAVLNGPTGGYLLGFVVAAFVVGLLAERGFARRPLTTAVAMLAGTVIIYIVGIARLQVFVTWGKVWDLGVQPFLIGDGIKLALAAGLLPGASSLIDRYVRR